jgi:uncharacterized NAD(P)/FAD-binding protein YdhS
MTEAAFDLAILGRGAAGCALLAHLADAGFRGRILVLGAIGTVAFHACQPWHLLNTRVSAMDIAAPDSDGFHQFLAAQGQALSRHEFAPRRAFGAYLDACETRAFAALNVVCIAELVEAIMPDPAGWRLQLQASQQTFLARAGVCAIGYGEAKPALHPGALSPWAAMPALGRAVVVGAGLSGVDAVQSLLAAGHPGPITMISRTGLLPHAHALNPSPPASLAFSDQPLSAAVAHMREAAKHQDWRTVIDAIRPSTPAIWARAPAWQRTRLARSVAMDVWSIHRHRAAPGVLNTLQAAVRAGVVRLVRAQVMNLEDGFTLHTTQGPISADHVIDARGPAIDGARNRLFAPLLQAGLAQRSLSGLGLCAASDHLIATHAGARLFALGAVHFGERLETTAFPELRAQAGAVAATLTANAA